ncbi:spore gernimation protein GerPD [Thalassobacillus sp. CUG 92003]|uniref:spore gernimation protein GerPD n=1 Tax=Thalassobacillus sp. CUG 92003 TaxID=2736641 RepID=UPI0015E702F7|nr:spore gernimation protein GerPD [Thalassobacillus sp. CUG 92003]
MAFTVHNYGLYVGDINVTGLSSSSVFLIGDNKTIQLRSYFDTPPESLIIKPLPAEQVQAGEDATNDEQSS